VHIPRQRLRELLLTRLAPGTVCWGTKVAGFEAGGAAALAVTTTGGARQEVALLVGVGLGRIVALYHRSSTLYQIHSNIRCLCF
jgi:hypothetical protein